MPVSRIIAGDELLKITQLEGVLRKRMVMLVR